MDVLSEVLRVVRLSGAIHFCAEFTRPWAILSSPPEMLATRLYPGAEAVIPFHIATAGRCWLSWGNVAPIPFEAGDVVVFARGAQHVLASQPGVTPVPIKDIYRPSPGQITVLQHGGGGEECRFICGFLHSDQRFGPLLDAMPALTCVRVRDGELLLEAFTDAGRFAEPVRSRRPALVAGGDCASRRRGLATRPRQPGRAGAPVGAVVHGGGALAADLSPSRAPAAGLQASTTSMSAAR